ncbi:MAG TPA: hypothetical protein VMG14_07660 [Thermoplasmata archaeon]|nr:hypothetical protein [Thermoplasmata archaeon]
MARRGFGPGARRPGLVAAALASFALVLIVLPAASLAGPASAPTVAASQPAVAPGISATVTWNGANILNYTSATSAARIGFNDVVDVEYHWSSSGLLPAPVYTITDARLQIFYFGFALATRDIVNSVALPSTSGNFTMNWTTGSLQYVLEGSYRLVASLIEQNGTTAWSQAFWVYVAAPFYVGALLPIVLILIAIWEIYNIATVGKLAAVARPKTSAPPKGGTPESAEPTTPAAGSATAPPAADTGTGADPSPPPSGGAS